MGQESLLEIIEILKEKYGKISCELIHSEDYELMIAARLSARCKDDRVNVITKRLFRRYPTLHSFASADFSEVEEIIRPCGLSNTKARDIVAACQMLEVKFGGKLPSSIERLIELPGVGRKTANLILAEVFHEPAVICDVHCIRISNKLGLCRTKDPSKVERVLRAVLPPQESTGFCHRLVRFGKDVCRARNPKCGSCELVAHCDWVRME
ncbi:MAG: endonuclease III [Oscillospiraceae bacterium]|nr:endonuclease III [Oscillospiraceae bacterium]